MCRTVGMLVARIKKKLWKEEEPQQETTEEDEKHRIEKIERSYKPGPHEDPKKREQDFERLSEELQRQFELRWQADVVVDTKTGIILGFIMLILVQIALSVGLIGAITSRSVNFITVIFSVGYALIFCSFVVGMMSFWIGEYYVGASAHGTMFPKWWRKEKQFYSMDIFTNIAASYEHNKDVSDKKVGYLRWMLIFFLIGFILILISTILFEVT